MTILKGETWTIDSPYDMRERGLFDANEMLRAVVKSDIVRKYDKADVFDALEDIYDEEPELPTLNGLNDVCVEDAGELLSSWDVSDSHVIMATLEEDDGKWIHIRNGGAYTNHTVARIE